MRLCFLAFSKLSPPSPTNDAELARNNCGCLLKPCYHKSSRTIFLHFSANPNFSFQFLEQSWVSQNWNGAKGMIAYFSFEIQQIFLDNFQIVMSPVPTLPSCLLSAVFLLLLLGIYSISSLYTYSTLIASTS